MKKIIVLGGSSGIGKAIATRFAAEGWSVLVAGVDHPETMATLATLTGSNHKGFEIDVRKDELVSALAAYVQQEFSEFDALVNCVGISDGQPIIGTPFNQWDNTLQVMLYGTVKCTRALIPLLRDGGRIINVTSIHYERVAANSSAYGMAKAAITQFTRSLAVELAAKNILVNAIAPGFINTPMSIKADGKNELDSPWFHENYIRNDHLPLKRAGNPEEVAGVAWFLAGKDASYMTGSVLTVDGGLTITF